MLPSTSMASRHTQTSSLGSRLLQDQPQQQQASHRLCPTMMQQEQQDRAACSAVLLAHADNRMQHLRCRQCIQRTQPQQTCSSLLRPSLAKATLQQQTRHQQRYKYRHHTKHRRHLRRHLQCQARSNTLQTLLQQQQQQHPFPPTQPLTVQASR